MAGVIFFIMNWSLIVLLGAVLNVIVNYGYKLAAAEGGVPWVAASVMAISSLVLATFALVTKKQGWALVAAGRMPAYVIGLAFFQAFIFSCFLMALATGPISLIDPLWACIYSLVSIMLGMMVIRERPSPVALLGIAFYLTGALLMGWGAQ